MWPDLFVYGWFRLTVFGIYLMGAGVLTSFALWRRLRPDFADKEIFEMTIGLTAGPVIGTGLGSLIETGRWFGLSGWGVVLGVWWALWRWSRVNKMLDFWELADWFAVVVLWFWFLGAIAYGPQAGFAGGSAFAAIVVTKLVKSNYRKFRWYLSGRVGIVALTAVSMYALYEIAAGWFYAQPVYWWGLTLGQTAAAWVIAFCAVAVYLRGGNKFLIDVKIFHRKT